jgi:hypothetical protein
VGIRKYHNLEINAALFGEPRVIPGVKRIGGFPKMIMGKDVHIQRAGGEQDSY